MKLQKIIRNGKYIKVLFKRIGVVGFLAFFREWFIYYEKYIKLPYLVNAQPTVKYKLFVAHNYFRILWYNPTINREELMNMVPTLFAKTYLAEITNPPKLKQVLVDKIEFYRILKKNNLPFPKTFFYSLNGKYFGLEGNEITDLKLWDGEDMFVKSLSGSSGFGADMIKFNHLNNYAKEELIFQEIVEPHYYFKSISPGRATPMLRIGSYLTKENKVDVLSANIKFPGENATTSNVLSGSLSIGISLIDGSLKKPILSQNGIFGITDFENQVHPNSGYRFSDIKIPFWDETISLLNALHNVFPAMRMIGWDIAITPQGPVVIEGNSVGDINTSQLISQPFYQTTYIQENLNPSN